MTSPMLSPMLAPNKPPDLDKLDLSLYWCSEKMDGIRCIVFPHDIVVSRSGKALPQPQLELVLGEVCRAATSLNCVFEGELWSPDRSIDLQRIVHYVMSKTQVFIPPKFDFYCFDAIPYQDWLLPRPHTTAYERASYIEIAQRDFDIAIIQQYDCYDEQILQQNFDRVIEDGGEGLMLKHVNGTYKHGRCTQNDQRLYKMKAYTTIDAVVSGYTQQSAISPDAERTKDELGRPKPIYTQEDRRLVDALGALTVMAGAEGRGAITFDVGSGFTDEQREYFWSQREALIGKVVEIKYMATGGKDKPRHPVFLRFKEEIEL